MSGAGEGVSAHRGMSGVGGVCSRGVWCRGVCLWGVCLLPGDVSGLGGVSGPGGSALGGGVVSALGGLLPGEWYPSMH